MKVVLYSTHCPRCKVLEAKLKQKNIDYTEETDVDKMLAIGLKSAPALQVDDGELMEFGKAVQWIKEYAQ